MSLDVYLEGPEPVKYEGSGIFVREGGQTIEITEEEWSLRNPGREPVRAVAKEESNTIYSANITHNLANMAREAGVYEALWRPAELDPSRAARIREQEKLNNYHEAGGVYEIEREAQTYARDLIQPLRDGLALLQSAPERFEEFNPENGWGDYLGLCEFIAGYLAACTSHPNTIVRVWR